MTAAELEKDRDGVRRYAVPALEKGLDVIELLARSPDSLSMSAVATALDRTVSEIFRVMQCLESRAYVERDPESERYRLSMMLFNLAHTRPPTKALVSAATPVMDRIAASTMQSCHLAVMDDLRILVVAQVSAPTPMHYAVRLGAQFPVWETSSGLVLLAYQPEEARRGMIDRIMTVQSDVSREELEMRCSEALRTGCEVRTSAIVSGITNITYPIFNHQGRIAAVLTSPFLPQVHLDVSTEEASALIAAGTREISNALGHHPG
ncbi:IclR family transcriptional regulator [Bosea sp. BK604]|uniref:IclR family transcriptional regulator n=1 Tax=Bosea sp. BK604 TaxID=2512180 RepID=UPI0010476513|nr:IclR family transcriptional regulator [Bosea sp. BK604]TCR63132.1 IclR family transcriptional regulator [Bosea sp. BK604]